MRKKIFISFLMLAAFVSCSEKLSVHTRNMDRKYLIVDALLNDIQGARQVIRLSESVSYFDTCAINPLKGAIVLVESSERVYEFKEDPEGEPGEYIGPDDFYGKIGQTYTLKIGARIDGEYRHYEATSEEVQPGFQVDSVDYVFVGKSFETVEGLDSLWQILIWGKDKGGVNYYYATNSLNGNMFSAARSISMDNKYFRGSSVSAFPFQLLVQSKKQQETYGPSAKPFETGDVLTVYIYSLTRECYDFMSSISSITEAIPLIATQPANSPTNIQGGDALGFFAVCSTSSASVVIDDPYRPYPRKP